MTQPDPSFSHERHDMSLLNHQFLRYERRFRKTYAVFLAPDGGTHAFSKESLELKLDALHRLNNPSVHIDVTTMERGLVERALSDWPQETRHEDDNQDYAFIRYELDFGQVFAWFLDADGQDVALPRSLVEIRYLARKNLGLDNSVTKSVLDGWPGDE
jgi:hypothetical protein